ncbi:MAG: DUF255 domain-containing protein [Puia sp.]|nr:DUF255 domain-containing protein [Puia sp.]
MKRLRYFIFFLSFSVKGQAPDTVQHLDIEPDTGIHFVSGLSWEQLKEKAKSENKYIFMDCFATWCVPCKFMSQNIFPLAEVGSFMNDRFLSVEVQTDQTPKDRESIKKWYDDAKSIVNAYSVNVVPTYLFFAPDGRAIHRIIGVTGKTAAEFVDRAKDALNPETQYYTLIDHYKEHTDDSAFLRHALITALKESDDIDADSIGNVYMRCVKAPLSKDNLPFFLKITGTRNAAGFNFLLYHFREADSIPGDPDAVIGQLTGIVTNEVLDSAFARDPNRVNWRVLSAQLKSRYPMLGEGLMKNANGEFGKRVYQYQIRPAIKDTSRLVDWDKLSNTLKGKYPGYPSGQLIADQKFKYYQSKKMWPEYEKAVAYFIAAYGERIGDMQKNNYAWAIFLHSNDRSLLVAALGMSKEVVDRYPDIQASTADTYANLLYKTGNKEEAAIWENRAIDLAKSPDEIKEYKGVLDKIKNGEKTW